MVHAGVAVAIACKRFRHDGLSDHTDVFGKSQYASIDGSCCRVKTFKLSLFGAKKALLVVLECCLPTLEHVA